MDHRLKAGRRFSDLRSFIFGNLLPRETLIHRVVMGGGISSGRDPFLHDQAQADQRLRQLYEHGLAAVKAISHGAAEEVVRLCHRQQLPDWSARLRSGLGQAGDYRAQSNLLDALDALADCFGYRSAPLARGLDKRPAKHEASGHILGPKNGSPINSVSFRS